ncbi:hypothetical protein [Paenibacillus amylolyticus]|nr:hypothetical protein [Paenibacillus amylolyticus]
MNKPVQSWADLFILSFFKGTMRDLVKPWHWIRLFNPVQWITTKTTVD